MQFVMNTSPIKYFCLRKRVQAEYRWHLGYGIRFITDFFCFLTGSPSRTSARTLKTTIEVAIIIYFYYYCFTGPVRFFVPQPGLVVVM